MQFQLYDAVSGGTAIGSPVTNSSVAVTQGIFTVQLDFGAAAFSGADRFLENGVRPAGNTNAITQLAPRQKITSAPYAIRSLNAGAADTAANATNSQQLGGAAANQFVQTNDARLSDDRNPAAGSPNYIQNTTTPQTSANFNIGGTGAANIVNAQTQYNIGGNRVLSVQGLQNIFAGFNAGISTSGGNSFFGSGAGQTNVEGFSNSFVGSSAGISNTYGSGNSFFGADAGKSNTGASYNSFIGGYAGKNNTIGSYNSFFGTNAGNGNISGLYNSFIGYGAGSNNTTGYYNTMLGFNTNPNVNNLDHATAIGADSVVSTSNTIALGRSTGRDFVRVSGLLQVGFGSTAFTARMTVAGSGAFNAVGAARFDLYNTAFGGGFLQNVTDGGLFQIATINGGLTRLVIDGAGNVDIGTTNPATRLALNGGPTWTSSGFTGSLSMPNISALGWEANSSGLRFGIGQKESGLYFFHTNSAFGTTTNSALSDMFITNSGDLGIGTTAPQSKLDVAGSINASGSLTANGNLTATNIESTLFMIVGSFAPSGATQVCHTSSGYLANCSSSLRYKKDVRDYRGGLNFINQLRPISYKWKADNAADVGFGAEDVAKINPVFVSLIRTRGRFRRSKIWRTKILSLCRLENNAAVLFS